VSKAQSVTNSCSDGDDVLERASEFYADNVAVRVDTEPGVAECLLHGLQQVWIGGCDCNRSRVATRNLLRERRAAESADGEFKIPTLSQTARQG
jgi:hypothetical protein